MIKEYNGPFCYVVGLMCNRPLGMRNNLIKNWQITASSSTNKFYAARLARLHAKRSGAFIGAWRAGYTNHYQWLRIYFVRPTQIVRISTQGTPNQRTWVTRYYLSFSTDGVHYAEYKIKSVRKVLYNIYYYYYYYCYYFYWLY